MPQIGGLVIIVFIGLFFLMNAIRILREYERGVIYRLGRMMGGPKGPGLMLLIPLIDKMVKVDMRTITFDIPPQDVITKDNVSVKVNAVLYFRILDPNKAINNVENYFEATSQIAQTSLRAILGQVELDELLSKRDKINEQLQAVIDEQTEPWGVKVSLVEVKNVDLPTEMTRAIAKQAEAERERRAKIIHAEGEFQASQKLADAARVIAKAPQALQLRYLQTLTEISVTNSSTVIFPLPIELIKPLMNIGALPEDSVAPPAA